MVLVVASANLAHLNADTLNESLEAIAQLFQQATKPPYSHLQVRALVEDSEEPWTEKQIDKAVKESLDYSEGNFPADAIVRQREFTRKLVSREHAGKRWTIVKETIIPGAIRIESRDFLDIKPDLDAATEDESTLFNEYLIQNYNNPELGYHFLKVRNGSRSEVTIDRSEKPIQITGWNLFQARHLESKAAISLGFALIDTGSPSKIKALQDGYGPIYWDILGPFPFSPDRATELLVGTAKNVQSSLKIDGTKRELRVDSTSGGLKTSSIWKIDQALPYLITAFECESGVNGSYKSYRTGVSAFDFPQEWRVVQKDANGKPTERKISILSVSTNFNHAALFSTNSLPAGRIWERMNDGSMQAISGITNWDGKQSPFSIPPPTPKSWSLQRAIIVVAVLLQCGILAKYYKRRRTAR